MAMTTWDGRRAFRWSPYAYALCVVALCTGVNWLIYAHTDLAILIMVYLLGVLVLAFFQGIGPSILSSISSVLAFDFLFVPPRFHIAVSNVQHLFIFIVMLMVALSISNLAAWVRNQAQVAQSKERRTATLYALSRELASIRGTGQLLQAALSHISKTFESDALALLPDEKSRLSVRCGAAEGFKMTSREMALAQWCFDFGQVAGRGTTVVPDAEYLYIPLPASGVTVGALAIKPIHVDRIFMAEQMNLLEALATQTAMAVASDRLTDENKRLEIKEENERIRSSLLSSVSHDLRTPLAAITGSASALLKDWGTLEETTKKDLVGNIQEESEHLEHLVRNLLEMTRLEAGKVELRKELQDIEDVVGAVLERMEKRLEGRQVVTAFPADLPSVPMDVLLVEQLLVNILDNVFKYTPAGSPIEISAAADGARLTVRVNDRGPGIHREDLDRLFDKFYRGRLHGSAGGAGLGLAICRTVVEAHEGAIWAENRPDGGASFVFTIPLETQS